MDNNDLSELLKYSDDNSILIVSYDGKLKELQCPFRVIVLNNIGSLKKGNIELVESVKITINVVTIFIIHNSAYYYFHFDILGN